MNKLNNKKSTPIEQLLIGVVVAEYPSMRECERVNNYKHSRISVAIKLGQNAYGYQWRKKRG